jgi:ATP phosphoribosyltransferase regulatory subunit
MRCCAPWPPPASRQRVFLPAGADPQAARALRARGIATVAQLSAADTAEGLRCTHILDAAGALRPVKEQ